jgi:hypothetical protein
LVKFSTVPAGPAARASRRLQADPGTGVLPKATPAVRYLKSVQAAADRATAAGVVQPAFKLVEF